MDGDPVMTDSLAHVISWKGQMSLSQLQGRKIQIRFHLRDTDLYAFQFSPPE